MKRVRPHVSRKSQNTCRIFGPVAAVIVLSLGGFASSESPHALLPDFASIADVKEKKRRFFAYIKPLALRANAEIMRLRTNIERALNEQSPSDDALILSAAKRYRVADFALDRDESLQKLLTKVDAIPLALILAQAANESGWGTSRFAREGNNLFGQWCFSKGCGLVPRGRGVGAIHEVQKFDSPYASIAAYLHNLNSHDSYQMLRDIRDSFRSQGEEPKARAMAEGLAAYSERGQDYIAEIQAIMDVNDLNNLDQSTTNVFAER